MGNVSDGNKLVQFGQLRVLGIGGVNSHAMVGKREVRYVGRASGHVTDDAIVLLFPFASSCDRQPARLGLMALQALAAVILNLLRFGRTGMRIVARGTRHRLRFDITTAQPHVFDLAADRHRRFRPVDTIADVKVGHPQSWSIVCLAATSHFDVGCT